MTSEREADLRRLAGGHDGHARLRGDPLRRELVAALPKRLGGRADPGQAGRLDRGGEVGVLGEEAVAGMDRVGAGLLRRADVLRGEEVALDLDRFVCGAGVQRAAVVRRGNRDGGDSELAAGAEDAHGDLAAVCHQELLDLHRCGWYAAAIPCPAVRRLLLVLGVVLLCWPASAGAGTLFVIDGRGWGHGVGMSQYGARGYAQAGWGYQRILAHYYRGTELRIVPARPVRVLLAERLPRSRSARRSRSRSSTPAARRAG